MDFNIIVMMSQIQSFCFYFKYFDILSFYSLNSSTVERRDGRGERREGKGREGKGQEEKRFILRNGSCDLEPSKSGIWSVDWQAGIPGKLVAQMKSKAVNRRISSCLAKLFFCCCCCSSSSIQSQRFRG